MPGYELASKLCQAWGIDPSDVAAIDISIRPFEIVTASIMTVNTDTFESLLGEYELRPVASGSGQPAQVVAPASSTVGEPSPPPSPSPDAGAVPPAGVGSGRPAPAFTSLGAAELDGPQHDDEPIHGVAF